MIISSKSLVKLFSILYHRPKLFLWDLCFYFAKPEFTFNGVDRNSFVKFCTCVCTTWEKWLVRALANRRMLPYFLWVSLRVSIWPSSSKSTVLLVFPSFSYSDCLEHLYVEIVQFLMFSSLLLFPGLGVVKETELRAEKHIMLSHKSYITEQVEEYMVGRVTWLAKGLKDWSTSLHKTSSPALL